MIFESCLRVYRGYTHISSLLSQPASRRTSTLRCLLAQVVPRDVHTITVDDTQHERLLSLVSLGHVAHKSLCIVSAECIKRKVRTNIHLLARDLFFQDFDLGPETTFCFLKRGLRAVSKYSTASTGPVTYWRDTLLGLFLLKKLILLLDELSE